MLNYAVKYIVNNKLEIRVYINIIGQFLRLIMTLSHNEQKH